MGKPEPNLGELELGRYEGYLGTSSLYCQTDRKNARKATWMCENHCTHSNATTTPEALSEAT